MLSELYLKNSISENFDYSNNKNKKQNHMCTFFFRVWQKSLYVFKEAYEEFKHILLAFIYDKDDQNSPVAKAVSFFWYYAQDVKWWLLSSFLWDFICIKWPLFWKIENKACFLLFLLNTSKLLFCFNMCFLYMNVTKVMIACPIWSINNLGFCCN